MEIYHLTPATNKYHRILLQHIIQSYFHPIRDIFLLVWFNRQESTIK